MSDWTCAACGAQWASGAPRCPECPSTEHLEEESVPKINRDGVVTYEADVPRDHPGTGEPMEGIEAPADGTEVTVGGDGPGDPGGQVVQLPDGEHAAPDGPAVAAGAPAQDAAPAPPRTPPRRAPVSGA